MKMHAAMAAVGLALAAPLSAEETQRVDGLVFDRVLVWGSTAVEIFQDGVPGLKVRGSEKALAQKPFYLDGDTLVVGRNRNGQDKYSGELKFRIQAGDLESIKLKGSGEVYVKQILVKDLDVGVEGSGEMKMFGVQGVDLDISLSGSGDIQIVQMQAENVSVALSGSGDIYFGKLGAERVESSLNGSGDISLEDEGTAGMLSVNVVGSGDVDFSRLRADTVEVNVVGSGSAMVFADDILRANIMGSGDVEYRGEPSISQNVLGSGDVKAMD